MIPYFPPHITNHGPNGQGDPPSPLWILAVVVIVLTFFILLG